MILTFNNYEKNVKVTRLNAKYESGYQRRQNDNLKKLTFT